MFKGVNQMLFASKWPTSYKKDNSNFFDNFTLYFIFQLFGDENTSEKVFCSQFFVSLTQYFTQIYKSLNLREEKLVYLFVSLFFFV